MKSRLGLVAQGAIGAVFLLALAACSTTDYSKPVNDFAAATGNAEKALADLNAEVTQAYKGVLDRSIASGDVVLDLADDECLATDSVRCRLAVTSLDTEETEFYPPEPPLVRMTLLMGQINRYASNLKALLEADTAAKVEASVNAAFGSAQNLAETVAEARAEPGQPTPAVPQFATPAGAAVNWVVGQYIEQVKYKGLQRATAAAKTPVRDAADLFAKASAFASDIPRADLANGVTAALNAYKDNESEANKEKLVAATAKYDAFLVSTPPDLFQRLGDAHDALADSLQGGEVTFGEAIGKIEAFAVEAEKLAKILKDIRAILPSEPAG